MPGWLNYWSQYLLSKLKMNEGFDPVEDLEAGLQDNIAGNNACWETLDCVRRRVNCSPLLEPSMVFSF